jgi:hypothetical protein
VASSAEYIGWGSGAWERGSWGLDLTEVYVDGAGAAGQVGNVFAYGTDVVLQGVEGVGALGTVVASASATAPVQGVSAAAFVGTVQIRLPRTVLVEGVEAEGFVGSVFLWGAVDDNQAADWQNVDATAPSFWTPVVDAQTASWEELVT